MPLRTDVPHQLPHEIVQVDPSMWPFWRDDPIFHEGARAKFIVTSPASPPFYFLRSSHPYLFKRANRRYPWQFWEEIFAYRFGLLTGVPLPPTYLAFAADGSPGAFSEFFYETNGPKHRFDYVQGGDLLRDRDPNYAEPRV